MNNSEAKEVLARELATYRSRPYRDLINLLDQSINAEVQAQSGILYQVQIQVFGDERPDGNLRVAGAVDDGGRRASLPLTDSFILAPDGSFVDE